MRIEHCDLLFYQSLTYYIIDIADHNYCNIFLKADSKSNSQKINIYSLINCHCFDKWLIILSQILSKIFNIRDGNLRVGWVNDSRRGSKIILFHSFLYYGIKERYRKNQKMSSSTQPHTPHVALCDTECGTRVSCSPTERFLCGIRNLSLAWS